MKTAATVLLSCLMMFSLAQSKSEKEITGKLPLKIFSKNKELKQWFLLEYNSYQPTIAVVTPLKQLLDEKQIVVVLGTWCSDSQREFPRLMKVLDAIRFPASRLITYGINKSKTRPQKIMQKYNITKVPTIIVLDKEQKEIGRITEKTVQSTEVDLLGIFKQ